MVHYRSWARGEGLPIGNHTFYFDTSAREAGLTMVAPFMLTPPKDR